MLLLLDWHDTMLAVEMKQDHTGRFALERESLETDGHS